MAKRIKLEGIKKIIAVASGKGGVGKSTVSVNLALALAKLGYRVGLFDGDIYGPDVPLMLGVRRQKPAEGEEAEVAIAISPDLEKPVPRGKPLERYGIKMMSLGLLVGEEQAIVPDSLLIARLVIQLLRSTDWGELDYLLIDLPPGTGEPQITLAQLLALDGVVLVTTPADVALLDTTKALNLYRGHSIPILGLVENMSFYICPKCGDRQEIFPRSQREIERSLKKDDIIVLGQIPLTASLGIAADSGRPLIITEPGGTITLAFIEAAQQIVRTLENSIEIQSELESTEVANLLVQSEKPAQTSLTAFRSNYLEEFSLKILNLIKEKLGAELNQLERDEVGMKRIAEVYRQAMQEIGTQMNVNLQRELVSWVMANVLTKQS